MAYVTRHYTKLFIVLFAFFFSSVSVAKSFTFGIVPQQSATKLASLWVPLLKEVSNKTGHKITFKTAKNIPEFEERLSEGKYDFAYMNPYHYTVYHESTKYNAIAKAKDKRIKGIIVVHKDSDFTNLADLAGEKIAYPSPAAFAATILTQSALKNKGISTTPKYVTSHDSVYRNISQKRYTAGGGVIRTFKNTEADVRENLRIMWTSNGFTPHAIAHHSRVSVEDAKLIQEALIELEKSSNTIPLLKKLKLKGFEAAQNEDWDDVRNLNIEILK